MVTSIESSQRLVQPESHDAVGTRRVGGSLRLLAVGIIMATAATSMTIGFYAASPWLIGFGTSTLLMWPLGLLLLNLAYHGASKQPNAAQQVGTDSEYLLETFLDQVAVGVAIIHTQSGRFVRVNGKYESLIGISNEEIRSKTWQEVTHPDDVGSNADKLQLLCEGQLSEFELEKRLIRGDGTTIWVNLKVSPTRHQGEIADHHIAIVEDITERRQAALKLAESEHRFRTLVENAPEAIIVLDVDQLRFVDFNENALRLFAASREEMANLGPIQLSPEFQPDGRSSSVAAQELFGSALAGETAVFEWTHCDLQGIEFICELHLVRLPATGRSLVQVSLTDISQRKQEEAKLRQQQAELAHVSRLSIMGEMVAQIAHEINQPLFAITNYAHTCSRVLSDKNLDLPEIVTWCGDIERESTRAAEIIRRLRGFMRKSDQPRTPTDMNTVVQETIGLLTPDARHHDVTLRMKLADEPVMILGEFIDMQQVLVNLIRNAYESFADSEVEHRLVTVTTATCGQSVEVAVFDNGPGFSDSDVHKIFDTFYSTKYAGLGMGLAISRTLTEAHGGSLTACNGEDSRGAILRISLPRIAAASQEIVEHSHV